MAGESQYSEGVKAFTTGEALAKRCRVKYSAGTVVYADAGEDYIGVTEFAVASGATVSVRMKNDSGTFKVVAAGAVAAGAYLYGADDGEVNDVASGPIQFIALEAATADQDIIEALPTEIESFAMIDRDIQLGDGNSLLFGDATDGDITMNWNASTFEVEAAANGSAMQVGTAAKTINQTIYGTFTVGVDDTGYDVKLFGATASKYLLWDESANTLIILGDYDITGNSQFTGTIIVGVDDTGHDVKFFGATASNYMLWDESADKLIILGSADLGTSCEADAYTVGGTAGTDYDAAVTNITVVKGIVTAAS